MPTLPDSLNKLSASMAQLSERAREVENKIAQAREMTQAQLEARIAEARDATERRRKEMSARASETKDDLTSRWARLRVEVYEHFEKIRRDIEEKRAEHDARTALRRAEHAEEHAVEALAFALDAIDEAGAAYIEAVEARVRADAATEAAQPEATS